MAPCARYVPPLRVSHPFDPNFKDVMPEVPGEAPSLEERKARTIIEKKTAINLIEAFAVATKHYLRGEEGIHYEDLFHLVKFLPPYALPPGLPPAGDSTEIQRSRPSEGTQYPVSRIESKKSVEGELPLPVTSTELRSPTSRPNATHQYNNEPLLPARNPPKFAIFDVFPFSLLVRQLTKRGKDVKGRKAARLRARENIVSHNIPLEISLYLVRFRLNETPHCCVLTSFPEFVCLGLAIQKGN